MVRTRPTGEKNGSKRHLLVDERGAPLSLSVTGANRHDSTQLEAALSTIMVKKPLPAQRRHKHLCADAAYAGEPAHTVIVREGYIPHVHGPWKEEHGERPDPQKKPRRWIVEVAHGWFNRFRKLLIRFEKLERSYLALCQLAAAIIVFRKIPARINIIYG